MITNSHTITTGSNATNNYQLGFQLGYSDQFFNIVYGADGSNFKDVLYLDYTDGFNASKDFYIRINAAYSNSNNAKILVIMESLFI